MSNLYEELHHSETLLGELTLRRRRYMGLESDVYEVKLGDDFLMSSLFTASEEALGRLGVRHAGDGVNGRATGPSMGSGEPGSESESGAALAGPEGGAGEGSPAAGGLDVVVGGLGLGYTAAAVLENAEVRSLIVVEYLEPVIEWHHRGLLPVSATLTGDPRCRFVSADFFAAALSDSGFDPDSPGRRFHAILADIDHTPDSWLAPGNNTLYTVPGLRGVRRHLLPGGVFGLWSNEPPEERFRVNMASAFNREWAELVRFHNPLQERSVTQTVYFGRREGS